MKLTTWRKKTHVIEQPRCKFNTRLIFCGPFCQKKRFGLAILLFLWNDIGCSHVRDQSNNMWHPSGVSTKCHVMFCTLKNKFECFFELKSCLKSRLGFFTFFLICFTKQRKVSKSTKQNMSHITRGRGGGSEKRQILLEWRLRKEVGRGEMKTFFVSFALWVYVSSHMMYPSCSLSANLFLSSQTLKFKLKKVLSYNGLNSMKIIFLKIILLKTTIIDKYEWLIIYW